MDNETLSARLKAFALMLKYGHDLFEAKDFSTAAALAVSNSRTLLNFRTASLLELADGKAQVIAQYGQPEANSHSRLAVVQSRFVESLELDAEPRTVTAADGLPAELAGNDAVYCCLKLLTFLQQNNLLAPEYGHIGIKRERQTERKEKRRFCVLPQPTFSSNCRRGGRNGSSKRSGRMSDGSPRSGPYGFSPFRRCSATC